VKIAILDTYYTGAIETLYAAQPALARSAYRTQHEALIDLCFGTSDFYSSHLRDLGHEAHDLIVNCEPLQRAWACEQGLRLLPASTRLSHRLFRLPWAGRVAAALSGLARIAIAQIERLHPDILYCQDLWFLTPAMARRLRRSVRRIVGQTARPLPPREFLASFDLIVTSFPHYVPRLRAGGMPSEYLPIGFDPRVLARVGQFERDVAVSFVGGLSRHHGRALPLLEVLAQSTPIEFFGYGAERMAADSPIRARHRGQAWALDMYRVLARSRITVNRHIDAAENHANNMRLYEATGMGALLLTDRKDNLASLFEPGKEVVVYSTPAEAVDLIHHYLAHPEDAEEIARAGQARTLREHTYRRRMEALVPILESCLARPSRA
jgi:hypothetical protein